MRKVNGIKSLIAYLDSENYPVTEEKINVLILRREIPHHKPFKNMIVFNLDHIDWWINEQRSKKIVY
ncbi:hypothetical protein [Jeotgalibacillus soli]|uniref:Uncharacterized protein n=1 Tax=Jeotgalibacillus soli TaxID=889306 RepID=A0A0C2R697_9BACL|nr:hypothetical protein [Jeotgalibacillus soli]KIL45780.1 hypothetical protein KP78_21290 [Jeotgalibacillus soli]